MPIKYFIGVDVAKLSLEATVLLDGVFISSHQVVNSGNEIKVWLKELSTSPGIRKTNALFCLEYSGFYNEHLITALTKKGLNTWVESSMQIKRSMGMQRGKSDQIDSLRIARYAYLHRASFRPWSKPRPQIEQLKSLSGLRCRLISAHKQLTRSLREAVPFLKQEQTQLVNVNCTRSIEALETDRKQTEAAMLAIITSDERLQHLYEIVTSVEYIGRVVGTEILITTNEFKNFATARKFACYCGVVPFEHSSGTSLRGKTHVSKMANKRMKSLLHMAAVASITHPGELKSYYMRRVAQGHPKMSVLNAIRNKLVHRIFACVTEDRCFVRKDVPAEVM